MSHQLTLPDFPAPALKAQNKPYEPAPKPVKASNLFEPFAQCISIKPNCLSLYTDYSSVRHRKKLLAEISPRSVTRILNTGTMSRQSSSKFKLAMDYLSLITKTKKVFNDSTGKIFYMTHNFITLTLSDKQKHSDGWIKKHLLKNWFDTIKKSFPAISFVWKAETQANGNLHFHIITDHFIPFTYINKTWNRIQWKNGYMKKYLSDHGHINAPSTEVQKIKNDKVLKKYLMKYMIKANSKKKISDVQAEIDSLKNKCAFELNQNKRDGFSLAITKLNKLLSELKRRKVQGKIWGCTDNLLLKPYSCELENLGPVSYENIFSLPQLFANEFFSVFKIDNFVQFIKGFSSYDLGFIRDYYKKLIPKPVPLFKLYHTNENYSYKLN